MPLHADFGVICQRAVRRISKREWGKHGTNCHDILALSNYYV